LDDFGHPLCFELITFICRPAALPHYSSSYRLSSYSIYKYGRLSLVGEAYGGDISIPNSGSMLGLADRM
jgi:hypothetical protein